MAFNGELTHLLLAALSLWLGVYAWVDGTLFGDPPPPAPVPVRDLEAAPSSSPGWAKRPRTTAGVTGVHQFWLGLYALVLGAFISGSFAAGGVGLAGDIALFAVCSTAVALTWLRRVVATLPFGRQFAHAGFLNPRTLRMLGILALVLSAWAALSR